MSQQLEAQPTQTHSDESLKLPIYLDNHATTPVDPRVLEAMLPCLTEQFGNAASNTHRFGWTAQAAVETARQQVAKLIGAQPKEIVFTSGATESDNLAVKGVAETYHEKGDHIVTAVTEHKAVLDSCKHLEKHGYRVTYLPVQSDGRLDLDTLTRALDDKTILVTIMAANNEIGVLQPVKEIGQLCRERGIIFHSDATQAAGKIPVNVDEQNLDLISISAHKMYGPKGVGALYVRSSNPAVKLAAMIDGGGHEHGMRSGTLNVPGIVGLGKACAIAQEELEQEGIRLTGLRDRLRDRLTCSLEGVHINGSMEHRLPGNLNVSFAGVDGQSLLMGLSNIAVSTGAACSSASAQASHVLMALGIGYELADSSIRFGIGRFNSEAEIDYAADRVIETVKRLREVSSL